MLFHLHRLSSPRRLSSDRGAGETLLSQKEGVPPQKTRFVPLSFRSQEEESNRPGAGVCADDGADRADHDVLHAEGGLNHVAQLEGAGFVVAVADAHELLFRLDARFANALDEALEDGALTGFDEYCKKQQESDPAAFQSEKPAPTFANPIQNPAPHAVSAAGLAAQRYSAQFAPKGKE